MTLDHWRGEAWVGPPEPELWQKADGYAEAVYVWAVMTDEGIAWFTSEEHARSAFAAALSGERRTPTGDGGTDGRG